MAIAYWCVLVAAVMPYAFTIMAKASKSGFDNRKPREFLAALDGWGARANWAQQNSFEAFAPFAAAVIIAMHIGQVAQGTIDMLALGFIACRVAYGACYLLDQATLRSLFWFGGIACWVALFSLSA